MLSAHILVAQQLTSHKVLGLSHQVFLEHMLTHSMTNALLPMYVYTYSDIPAWSVCFLFA